MATYLSRLLFDIRPHFDDPVTGQVDDFSFESVGMGEFTPWKPTSGVKRKVSYPFIFQTLSEAKALRSIASTSAGRRKGFWLPLWFREYELTTDASAGASTLTVRKSGIDSAQGSFTNFGHLFIANGDGKLECYGISGVTTSGDTETITLSDTLDTDAPADDTICGGLIFARFAEDTIDYQCEDRDVVRCRIPFVELPSEYASAHTGSIPVELFEITIGADVYRYAAWLGDVEAGGETWSKADITRGSISSGLDFLSEAVELTLATNQSDHPLRRYLDRYSSGDPVQVRIFTTDGSSWDIDTSAPLFSGRIQRVRFSAGGKIIVTVSSLLRIGEQEIPRMQIQRTCNHRLFSDGCGLDQSTFSTEGTVTAIQATSPAYVEAAEFGAKATTESDPDWFALGRVIIGTEVRLCVGQDGDRLYLNAPFRSASVSDDVEAVPGCDKRISTCETKFNNLENFAGFPYIPGVNPHLQPLATPKPTAGKKG